MFRPDAINTSNRVYANESVRAHQLFLRLVRAAQDEGWHRDDDTGAVNAAVWGLAHGLAALWTRGPLQDSIGGQTKLADIVDHGLDMLLSS